MTPESPSTEEEETPSHNTSCECERCKDPDAYDEKIKDIVDNGPGWYAHFVFDDKTCPFGTNVHTHGLPEKHNHPDLQICFPMPPKQAHAVLWGFLSTIEDNRKNEPSWTAPTGVRVPNVLANHDVLFLPVEESDRTVLRMVLPDPANKFDTEPYSKQFDGTGVSPQDIS